uniref:Four and a half LIM domains protein 2 n=1 Tax=Sinocyclocheilus grahami TaxID=75366 RepID=A0A672RTU0_SINGR
RWYELFKSKMAERYDCHYCKESLFGKKYVLRDENPYCVECYESLYSNTCEECKKPIGCNSRDLSYKDRHWHDDCFHCFKCHRSLVDKPFSTKDEQLLCTECYSNEYSSKCFECKKTIMPGNYCVPCYEKQFALQCVHCKKVHSKKCWVKYNQVLGKIGTTQQLGCFDPAVGLLPRRFTFNPTAGSKEPNCGVCPYFTQHWVVFNPPITTGGVTYHGQPWHKDCFLCTGCKEQLSGQRFTSRDDFPYCLNCFCNLYAKKCAECTTPISGLGGTKYISFEERQWHNDCFNCKKCLVSLVGRGFLTERDDILCPDCGKDI